MLVVTEEFQRGIRWAICVRSEKYVWSTLWTHRTPPQIKSENLLIGGIRLDAVRRKCIQLETTPYGLTAFYKLLDLFLSGLFNLRHVPRGNNGSRGSHPSHPRATSTRTLPAKTSKSFDVIGQRRNRSHGSVSWVRRNEGPQ